MTERHREEKENSKRHAPMRYTLTERHRKEKKTEETRA